MPIPKNIRGWERLKFFHLKPSLIISFSLKGKFKYIEFSNKKLQHLIQFYPWFTWKTIHSTNPQNKA